MTLTTLMFSLFASLVLILPATISQPLDPRPASWKIALHWPNSFCLNSGVKCIKPIPKNTFVIRTIYGVSQFDQDVPPCEGPQPPLNRSYIDYIDQTHGLSNIWPNLQGDNFEMWQKEWQDRAACYGISFEKYFVGGAVGLKVAIDRQIVSKGFCGYPFSGEQVFGTLYRQGVRPGNTYPHSIYADKVSQKYGEALEVLCSEDTSNVSQLLEFHMCATEHPLLLDLIPCPSLKTGPCQADVRFT